MGIQFSSVSSGGSSGLPSTAEILAVNASRNLLATDVGKLLVTSGNVVLTFDVAEGIATGSVISVLAGDSSTVAFDVADDEVIEGGSTVLQAGQQAELVFIGANTAVLVRRSVDGTAINPSSIGATTITTSIRAETIDAPLGGVIRVFYGNGSSSALSARGVEIGANGPVFWTLGSAGAGNPRSLSLWMDDSNILAQRNDTNAQESRLYGTYTSSTVYERLSSKYDSGSGAFVIGTEKGASGGSARDLILRRDGTDILTISSTRITSSIESRATYFVTTSNAAGYVFSSGQKLALTGTQSFHLVSGLSSGDTLQLGGATNGSADGIAFKQVVNELQVRTSDDSAFAAVQNLYQRYGSGTPESVVTAPVGAVYHRTDGGTGTSFYVKESGTGNTGWVAK